MATHLTIRTVDGSVSEAAFSDGRWVDPRAAPSTGQIDTGHLWAVPGLADCHAHLAASTVDELIEADDAGIDRAVLDNAWAQLSAGVFLVIDKGSKNSRTLRVLDQPPERRPHVEAAGRIVTVAGGYYPGFGHEVDVTDLVGGITPVLEEAAAWVKLIGDWPRKGQGAVTNFSGDELATIVDIAHQAGRRVAVHAAAPHTSSLAVAAGVDSIEHGLFLTPDDITSLGARGGAWVPTVKAMKATRDQLGPESSGGRLFQQGLENIRELLSDAPAAGVVVLAGTDLATPHGRVAEEAEALARYGLDVCDALDAVTGAAFRYTGRTEGFAVGEPANAVFFGDNPAERIETLLDPALVLHRGAMLTE